MGTGLLSKYSMFFKLLQFVTFFSTIFQWICYSITSIKDLANCILIFSTDYFVLSYYMTLILSLDLPWYMTLILSLNQPCSLKLIFVKVISFYITLMYSFDLSCYMICMFSIFLWCFFFGPIFYHVLFAL